MKWDLLLEARLDLLAYEESEIQTFSEGVDFATLNGSKGSWALLAGVVEDVEVLFVGEE